MTSAVFLPLPKREDGLAFQRMGVTLKSLDEVTPTTASPRSVDSISPQAIDALSLLHQDYDLLAEDCYLIGSGSSGSVWSARSRSTGKYVAVKTISREAYSSNANNEAEVLRTLQGVTGVVRIIDSYIDIDHDVVVMELCAGADLQRWKADELDSETVKSIVHELLRILKTIHEIGYSHMDIRLENVIVSRNEVTGVPIVTLIDFGSSIESVAEAALDIRNTGKIMYELLSDCRLENSAPVTVSDLLVLDTYAQDLVAILLCANRDNSVSVIEAALCHEWFDSFEPGHIRESS